MTDQIVRLGPEYFPRATSGVPISGGSIFIGEPDTDPEIVGNQIQVSALQENGTTVPISQPILTSGGGVPLYNGAPVTLLVSESYSLKVLDAFDVQIYNVPSTLLTSDSSLVTYNQGGVSAIDRNVEEKLQESVSVKDFGAVGDGATNDTDAFTAARTATNGGYFIPEGEYILDASPDVWDDPFTSGNNVTLTIAATPFDASRCFAGQFKIGDVSDTIFDIDGARSGEHIFRISDGSLGGQSHRYFIPWDCRRDSHYHIASPGTDGGSTDRLLRRSEANADSFGNRFQETFDEGTVDDTLTFLHATTESGSPSFDAFMQVVNGLTPTLKFPAIRADFEQGFKAVTRSTPSFDYNHSVADAEHTIEDSFSGNVISRVDAEGQEYGGRKFYSESITDIQAADGSHALSRTVSLGSASPVVFRLAASGQNVSGTLRVVTIASGGTGFGVRHIAFQSDETTITEQTIGVDNLVAQFHADLALNSGILDLTLLYDGGLGGSGQFSFSVDWDSA